MKLSAFNGSPRGKKSNTRILLEKVLEGFSTITNPEMRVFYLSNSAEREKAHQAFADSDLTILAFPLYTDSMPGLVKEFIESLAPYVNRNNNPKIAFLVQSGFPEALHSRYVERYLEKLARRLNAPHAGTIVKGGCEALQWMSEKSNQKLFNGLHEMGVDLAQEGAFDPKKLKNLSKPERYPRILAPVFKLAFLLPISQYYWNYQLKENGAYEARFARPFQG
jgi:multimeric flavodoxin WrbA